MLNIYLNEPSNLIKDVDYWFFTHKKKDWFNRQDVKSIILEIDNTIAVKDEYLESPIFGGIAPEKLSTGCKALILMLVQDRPVYATKCGDNCGNAILRIAEMKDLTICLHHCFPFKEVTVPIRFVESNNIVNTRKEYIDEYYKIKHSR